MKKQSNFELLRIISMILIVLHHFGVHTPWKYYIGFNSQKFLIQIFSIGGKIGVNCFVLITAYFLSQRTTISSSLKRTWQITSFYSILITILLGLFFGNIPRIEILKGFIPVITNQYWFVTSYIILLFFVPLLNVAVNNLGHTEYKRLLITLFTFLSVLSSIPGIEAFTNSIIWFIFLFLIGAYIRLFCKENIQRKTIFLGTLSSLILLIITLIGLDILSGKYSFFYNKELSIVKNNQNFLLLIISIGLFLLFKDYKMKYNFIINKIASTMFSVYLIHDNPLIRVFYWKNVLRYIDPSSSVSILFFGVCSSLLILIVSILIDIFRQELFTKISGLIKK